MKMNKEKQTIPELISLLHTFLYLHTPQNLTQITLRPDLSLMSDRNSHSSQALPPRSSNSLLHPHFSSCCFSAPKSSFHCVHPNYSQSITFPGVSIFTAIPLSAVAPTTPPSIREPIDSTQDICLLSF